jgi:SAM-dependent methyltransferase
VTAEVSGLFSNAIALEEAERPAEALALGWRALDLAPADPQAKRLVVRLLRRNPALSSAERRGDLERLLGDPDIDPGAMGSAGWMLLLAQGRIAPDGDPEAMASALECDPLALRLLGEACVFVLEAELALTRVRRWLLLSGRSGDYPRLGDALAAQAAHNGGAWPFDAEERDALEQSAFRAAYLPKRAAAPPGERFNDSVTQAVADQYVRWPYPVWSRLTAPEPSTVPREVEKLDGGRPSGLPVKAEILIAGCGTGREVALLARRFPDAHVTGIDISAVSLAYAAERCAGLNVDFRLLDLHEVARLGAPFDVIVCSGVLHHLPDPEAGWAELVKVVKPGGAMQVMVYSRVARLAVEAAKSHIADLGAQPVDDDLLRAVRARLIDRAPAFVRNSPDFYSLGGVHDLLLHRHEDAFDVPRITRDLDELGLELLAFKLPTSADRVRYRREHPEDPLFRDVEAWAALEKTQPFLFGGMYEFWCRRPG